MRKLPQQVWKDYKNWRNVSKKVDRYTEHFKYMERCLNDGRIPKGFKLKSKVTFDDHELRQKCQELNDMAARESIPQVMQWLSNQIQLKLIELKDNEDHLYESAGEELYTELLQDLMRERGRNRTSQQKTHEKKFQQLVNPSTAHNSAVDCSNRSSFCHQNNRRKNKNNRRRLRKNWMRNRDGVGAQEIRTLLSTSKDYPLSEDMFDAFNLTGEPLTSAEAEVCKLGLKYVPTVRKYDRVKKWFDIQAFKRKLRLQVYHHRKKAENSEEVSEELVEGSTPWKVKSTFEPPKGQNKSLEEFVSKIENELLNPSSERRVKDNLTHEQRQALNGMNKWNKDPTSEKMIRVQDKGSRFVVESKTRYVEQMLQYLENRDTFQENESDQSELYEQKVKDWMEKWKEELSEGECAWLTPVNSKPGRAYGNIKTHKDNHPYRYIMSANGTAIENLARWIEYYLKDLARKHPAYIKDTREFLSYLQNKNDSEAPFDKTKIWLVSRDIVNYYPSCSTDMCIESVDKLLDTREEDKPAKDCILDALRITMSSNNCEFVGRHFTQRDGATIGGPESASVTDIYGAVFIDRKILKVMNDTEDWRRYRDDSWSISQNTSREREVEKTEWMNNNIVKDKIKFTMEADQKTMIFLDTRVNVSEDANDGAYLSTDMYSKKTDTHQYLNPSSCHPKSQSENIPITVATRIRSNCSDNVPNDQTFKDRLVEYKAYLMKSGHSETKIDQAFCKIAGTPRQQILQSKTKVADTRNKTRFITAYEPSFPDIYKVFKKYEHLIKNDTELRNIFPEGSKHFQVVHRRGGMNIKEWIASPKINAGLRNSGEGGWSPCGKSCIDCIYFNNRGQRFRSTATGRSYKMRQNVTCISKNVIYLVTCRKCHKQGVGETGDFKHRTSNYRSCINRGHISCNIDRHFVDNVDHSIADFDIQIICQLENPPRNKNSRRIRRKQFEGYWQINLCTLEPYGMNSINELEVNLKHSDKNIFYPEGCF